MLGLESGFVHRKLRASDTEGEVERSRRSTWSPAKVVAKDKEDVLETSL